MQNTPEPEKSFTDKDRETIQQRIRRVWEALDRIEAETKAFKEVNANVQTQNK
jgi:hypothetical protein